MILKEIKMTDLEIREAFNEWVAKHPDSLDLTRYEKDIMFDAWQAAKTQAVPEWISIKDQLPPNDPYNREYWVYETLNNKVQHDYWVCPDTELDQDFEPFFNNWIRKVTHWMPMVKYPNPPVQAQEPDND